jgi:hypothetical protein
LIPKLTPCNIYTTADAESQSLKILQTKMNGFKLTALTTEKTNFCQNDVIAFI